MLKLLERLRSRREEIEVDAGARVEEWVRAEATGADLDVDAEEITRVFDEAGVTPDIYQERVDRLLEYRRLAGKAQGFLEAREAALARQERANDLDRTIEEKKRQLDLELKGAKHDATVAGNVSGSKSQAIREARDAAPPEHFAAWMEVDDAYREVEQLRATIQKGDAYVSNVHGEHSYEDLGRIKAERKDAAAKAERDLPAAERAVVKAEQKLEATLARAAGGDLT